MIEMYEEFAGSHQEGPTLSLDIWNKFPLLPTPPRSPSHDSSQHDETNLTSVDDFTLLELPLEDDFGMVDLEKMVDLENNLDHMPGPQYSCGLSGMPCARPCTSCTQLAIAGSELRHDCMWRGTCTAEAHSYSRELHAHSHTHAHTDSLTGVSDMYLDSHSGFDALDFAPLQFRAEDEDSDDGLTGGEEYSGRPDTPSESSSETDTDEDQDEDDEYYDEITEYNNTGGASPSQVHVDHSYYCIRAPSPRLAATPTYPHTPSESEDEIDVVNLGSPDSAYSSGSDNIGSAQTELITTIDTAATTTAKLTTRISRKRVRSGGEASKHNTVIPTPAIPSINTTPALPTSTATTTFVTAQGSRKVLKIRTFNPRSKNRKQRQESPAHPTPATNGGSYEGAFETTTAGTLKRTTKSKKGIKHHYSNKKRKGGRSSEANDPVKRKLHNSMERMRRVDLRKCFDELRRRVPSLHDKDRAPKVEILRRASEHCYLITQRGRLLELEKEKQRKLRSELRKKLKLSKLALQ